MTRANLSRKRMATIVVALVVAMACTACWTFDTPQNRVTPGKGIYVWFMMRTSRRLIGAMSIAVGLVGCGSDDGVQGPSAPCDAIRMDYAAGLEAMADPGLDVDRGSLADVITFGYGNIEPDRLTSEQRADLRVMLDTAEQGRSDVLPNANRAEGIAAYDRFRASLDC